MYLWSCGTLKRFNSSRYSSLNLLNRIVLMPNQILSLLNGENDMEDNPV